MRSSPRTSRIETCPAPTQADVEDTVERLAYAFDPLRIVVFGSYARGDARPGSDLDLLVVLPTVKDKRHAALNMRHAFSGLKEGEIVYEANDSA